jgi:hypothetical protein
LLRSQDAKKIQLAGTMARPPEHELSALERLRRAINAAHELPQIQFAMESYCASARIPMFSYYHYPPVGAVDFGPDIQIYNFGWPADTYKPSIKIIQHRRNQFRQGALVRHEAADRCSRARFGVPSGCLRQRQ